MTRAEERGRALASVDVNTYDDWMGSTGHIAVVLRDGVPQLTGGHDNEDDSFSEYQFLLPLEPGQDFEGALDRLGELRLGEARGLFYYFPQSVAVLRELAAALGVRPLG